MRPEDPAVIKAQASLRQLQEDLHLIKITSPMYMPGSGPSAATACWHILSMLDWGLDKISVYLGVPLSENSFFDQTRKEQDEKHRCI